MSNSAGEVDKGSADFGCYYLLGLVMPEASLSVLLTRALADLAVKTEEEMSKMSLIIKSIGAAINTCTINHMLW